jgi:AcrR family transcriptional regulator
MTTTRVAERAGVSVGSLYQYFPSKDALLVELLDRRLTRTLEIVREAIDASRGENLETRLRRMIEALLEFKSRDIQLGLELSRQTPRFEKEGFVRRLGEGAARILCELFEEHRDETVPRDPEFASALIVRMITGVLDGAVDGGGLELRDPRLPGILVDATMHVLRTG